MKNRRGVIIIIVLAILLLLTLIAITFLTIQLTERRIVRNYMDAKRAQMIAQAGIEYAIGRLIADPFAAGWASDNEPIATTLEPSFKSGELFVNGIKAGYSQVTGSTYAKNSDVFTIQVKDANSLINVNDGISANTASQAGNTRVSENTARIIYELAKITIGPETPVDIGRVIVVDKRPIVGYKDKQEIKRGLQDVYGGSAGEDYYQKLVKYITISAWQDPNVANPVPLSKEVLGLDLTGKEVYPVKYNQNIGIYRYGRNAYPAGLYYSAPDKKSINAVTKMVFAPEFDTYLGGYHEIHGLDEINPQWIEIVSRSPVNINQASEEVLISLIKDLKGFFLHERGGGFCYSAHAPLGWLPNLGIYYYDGASEVNTRELATILSTDSISESLARNITQEIKGCVNKEFEYSTFWFGGQFKTWRQFNAFCNYLVQKGIIVDSRAIFYEYKFRWYEYVKDLGGGASALYVVMPENMIASPYGKKLADQAIADVLKANFNPNLHLSEINSDANLYTLVDKTDLIVNSTEFCFTPMGYLEIESVGRLLQPVSGTDSLTAANNIGLATSHIYSIVKIYDVYRQTNQKQFLRGVIEGENSKLDQIRSDTNNLRTFEIGPEPAQNSAFVTCASENEWEGYIGLPSYISADLGAVFVARYTNGFNADLNSNGTTLIRTLNWPDRTEVDGIDNDFDFIIASNSPYLYGSKYRLARSYKSSAGTFGYNAMSDLRKDGAYVEKFHALVYPLSGTNSSILQDTGIASYWVKPSYKPEMASRDRMYFSISNAYIKSAPGGGSDPDYRYFYHAFYTSKNAKSLSAPLYEWGSPTYNYVDGSTQEWTWLGNDENSHLLYPPGLRAPIFYYKPASFVFGFSLPYKSGEYLGGGCGVQTPSLNHLSHTDLINTNYLKQCQWTHVVLRWNLSTDETVDTATEKAGIWVNGKKMDETTPGGFIIRNHPNVNVNAGIFRANADFGIRIGDPPEWSQGKVPNWTGYRTWWASDSTIDEFYLWQGLDTTNALSIWNQGRYYKPSSTESYFISGNLTEITSRVINIAATSRIPDPTGSAPPSSSINLGGLKILGVSWTYFGEGVDPTGAIILHDYKNYELAEKDDPSTRLATEVSIYFQANGSLLPTEYKDNAYSPVGLEVSAIDDIRYMVQFKINGLNASSILLYSPILDDVTIYYTTGLRYLSYSDE